MPTTLERATPRAAPPRQYRFRCYARRDERGEWSALCLDLNIRVHAGSQQEVIEKTTAAIQNYLETVIEAGWDANLIPRRAPWPEWIPWYLWHGMRWIRANRDHLLFLLTGPSPNQLTVAS